MGYLFIFRGCINSLACLAFSTANFAHPCWETRDKQWGRLSGGLSAVQPGAHVQGADCIGRTASLWFYERISCTSFSILGVAGIELMIC